MQAIAISGWLAKVNAWYQEQEHSCGCEPLDIKLEAIDLTPYQEVYKKLLKDVYEGKIKQGDINSDLIRLTYQELHSGASKGYGNGFTVVNDKGTPNATVIKMKQNIFKFSGVKNHAELLELNSKLNVNGKPASWETFKAEGLKLNQKYNVNHLQAEYQTAKQAGYHAANWETYTRDKDIFPNLKYVTQKDDRVRDSHRNLHGIIAPLNGDFWAKYYPPNGWRCRCYTVQTAERVSDNIPDVVKEIPPEFTLNVGKSGQIYNEGNTGKPAPYFALAKKQGDEKLRQAFELAKFTTPYDEVAGVKISPFADTNDLQDNFTDAKLLVKNHKADIEIRPHIEIDGWRNPEYRINGLIADRYAGSLKKGFYKKPLQIKQFIKDYNETYPSDKFKDDYGIVFNLKNIGVNDAKLINGKFTQGNKLQFVMIIAGGKSVEIKRGDSFDLINEKLNGLKSQKD